MGTYTKCECDVSNWPAIFYYLFESISHRPTNKFITLKTPHQSLDVDIVVVLIYRTIDILVWMKNT